MTTKTGVSANCEAHRLPLIKLKFNDIANPRYELKWQASDDGEASGLAGMACRPPASSETKPAPKIAVLNHYRESNE